MLGVSRAVMSRYLPANLAGKIAVGEIFRDTQKVLPHMTTNRTGKPGDDIFCTPLMIERMNGLALAHVSKLVPGSDVRVVKVSYTHKAPLGLGEQFLLQGQTESVDSDEASVRVLCRTIDEKTVLGDATITLKIFDE